VPLPDLPPDAEQAVIDINLGGTLKLARAAIPAMLRRPEPRSGRFIAVASAAATRGLPLLGAYCAAKAGIAGLVRSLGTELGPAGITANAVSPGSTGGAMLAESARLYGLPAPDLFAMQQPIGRLLLPGEIAAAIAFLASAESGGITGTVLPVDGGLAL
jgi:NAD(P)-dependent dehydrogenase (short-subunit alcohol dehydrogenase family)